MGKTPKPLNYLIDPSLVQTEEDHAFIAEKRAQGHDVVMMNITANGRPVDIFLGPHCWRAFDLASWDLATRSARNVKYKPGMKTAKPKKPRKPRKKKEQDDEAVLHD